MGVLSRGSFDVIESDKAEFAEMVTAAMEIHGREPSAMALRLWWRTLDGYSLGDVREAFGSYLSDPDSGRFPPTPAAIIGHMNPGQRHPCADEAWAMCLESFDEAATVCVTPQIMESRAVAQPVMEAGDQIGARMAFRAAYERMVRGSSAGPSWELSLGHDPDMRARAAEAAVRAGRLPIAKVQHLLTDAHQPERLRLPGKVTDISSARAEAMRKLGDVLGGQTPDDDTPRQLAERLRRSRISDAKAKALADLKTITTDAS